MFKKHFKCNPAAVSEFSNFDVLRLKIFYAIYKLQKAVLMHYLPFSKLNAALLFEMLSPVVLCCSKAVIAGHFKISLHFLNISVSSF